MIALPTSLLAGLGRLDARAGEFRGVHVDSRRVGDGDLFVAVGRGAGFLADAVDRGAAATLVPDDAFAALAEIARHVRDRSRARVVGITGSMGKTSTKDILAALCAPSARTIAAEASFNNEIGVPLTIELDRRAAIVRALELARPGDVVLIAGKGNESGQEFADRTIPFDDREVARDALRRLRSPV